MTVKQTETEIKKITRTALKDLANDFQGDRAFFFRNESDIQCRLFRRLTQKGIDTELVHAESGRYWDEKDGSKSRGYIDMVVWRPDKKKDALHHWREMGNL